MAQNDITEIKWNQYGYLAAQMASQKDINGARTMLKKAPLKTQDEHARKRLDIAYDIDEAVAEIAGREGRDYLVGVNTSDISQFPLIYDGAVSRLSAQGQQGLAKFLQQYAGKTIGDMKRTLYEANNVEKAEPGVYPDKAVESAAKTKKELEPYAQITGALTNLYFKPILAEVEADRDKATYKSLDEALSSGKF